MFEMPLVEIPFRVEPCRDLNEVKQKYPSPPSNWSCYLTEVGHGDETWVTLSKDGEWCDPVLVAKGQTLVPVTLSTLNAKLDKILEILNEH